MDDWRTRMRAELAARGVKITLLSEQLGYSRDYIGRMTKKGSNPGITDVMKVCKSAEISFVYVFTGKREDPTFDGVFNEMSKLTPEELTALKNHLKADPLVRGPIADTDKT
jgi:hypothetical protein